MTNRQEFIQNNPKGAMAAIDQSTDEIHELRQEVRGLKKEILLLQKELDLINGSTSKKPSELANRKHTCGGPVWGRKTPGCPRCDDLIAGADPVTWDIRPRESDASFSARLAAHDCSDCGPVCTAFDW